ncbi:type IV pilus biogenesis/stability protein PilW [Gilvimarinus agarilyticus]|uniref:type IV pilus biogenesis/stability protein PilW n=1 Tax=unclassified Gilvimarinus TaxID=2642066 RepID=UPI001C08E0F1|nr:MULTISPECIES: type IV pilus biogenesis/stability protein PilW [unclassified Gilvimarinus]MBU2887306.1 type IV pilus biogenesis/stability protein PilW [Gilvimarinus agarilyticus]MDO6571965.1 type IV pilus biogenesis/stability protein PilW [Gilvimarinus sp. 2_MG-2023]MDO6746033.1 type IV pilus biogenesis/stability protein PilW [Gilvimarinus sp. 1_MG-2023]
MQDCIFLSLKRVALVLMAAFLVACVSTQESSKYQINEDKALESHVTLALKYIDSKNRESARHHLRRALDLDSRSIDANFALAMLYQLEGEMELAEKQFKKTLRLDRADSRTHNNFGALLFNQGRFEEAYKQFEYASEDLDYKGRPQALVNLGRTALKLDKVEKAQAAFENAARLSPAMAVVKYEIASLYFSQGEYKSAKQYLAAYEQIARPMPQSLLLGIKIERMFDNVNKEASYALLLKNKFPYSKEYLEYKSILEQSEQ